jgi:hypothetical protein
MGKVIMFDEARAVRQQRARPAREFPLRPVSRRNAGPFAPAETARVVEGATRLAWWPVTFGLRLWEHSLDALGAATHIAENRRDGVRARRQ